MAYGRKLEDIIGHDSVYTTSNLTQDKVDDYTSWPTENSIYAHTLNFKGLGTGYSVRDLKLYGFDSTCATCPRHYSLMFTTGSEITYEIDNSDEKYKNVLIYIGVDININNGRDFVRYLFRAISSVPDFLDHYTHYGYDYDTAEFFIFDNRVHETNPEYYIQHMDFHTSAYVKIDRLEAVYNGPVIDIDYEYDPADIIVKRVWYGIDENGNRTTEDEYLNPDQYTLSTLIVSQEFTPVTVKDTEYDISCTVIIPGFVPMAVIWYDGPAITVSLKPNHKDFYARIYGLHYIYEVPNDMITVTHDEAPYCWRKPIDWFHASIPANICHGNPAWENHYCWVETLDNLISIEAKMLNDRLVIGEKRKAELRPEDIWILLQSNIKGSETLDAELCTFSRTWFDNVGIFKTEIRYRWYYHKDLYEEISCTLSVSVESSYHKIMAWYEEFPVEAVGTYDPKYVVIFLIPYVGDWERVEWSDPHVTIETYLVDKPDNPYQNMPWLEEGQPKWSEETWYKVTYTTDDGEDLSDIYPVIGYRKRKYVEKKFEVLYYNKYSDKPNNIDKWEDHSAEFQYLMSLGGTLVFDWYQFELGVKRIDRYGLYKITVPPEVGLDSRFWTEWRVIAQPNTNLCATMTHLYDEEDISDAKK